MAQDVVSKKSFNDGNLLLKGATSGFSTLKAPAVAGTTVHTLPDNTDTLVGRASVDTFTALKTFNTGTGSDIRIGTAISIDGNVTPAYGFNAYFSSGWKRINAGFAMIKIYDPSNGLFEIYTAPSGLADTAITWTSKQTFTQAGIVEFSNRIQNTRVTPRTSFETSNTAPSINTDAVDSHEITALAGNIATAITWTGTPTRQQKLIVSITATGADRTLSWNTSKFASSGGATLPTNAVNGVKLNVGFLHNITTGKFDCIAVA